MSIQGHIKNLSIILGNYHQILIDPFQNRKMDLYTYLCLKGMIKKIKSNFITKVIDEFPEEPVSDISWVT